ncbi:hypothetical protein OpiT1DRAFT_03227 [Opitutaceae bacterium TAV1]|nr:hypothetical protein OpiT1DRAFT_03227 [Opitutaceae bacterium TAV1]
MKTTRHITLAAAVLVAALLSADARASLILHYTFDDQAATNAAAGATAGDAALHNADGSAGYVAGNTPSGAGYAFSTGDGGGNYLAATGADGVALLADRTQLTITLWVNLQAAPLQYDRLLSWQSTASGLGSGFTLDVPNTGGTADNFGLAFSVTGSSAGTVNITEGGIGQWLFIAVTFDGAQAKADRVSYYVATTESDDLTAKVASGAGTDAGSLGNGISSSLVSSEFRIAGTQASSFDRSPSALFDDIRIYDTALTSAELALIWREGMTAVPESAAVAILCAAAALAAGAFRLRGRGR